MTGHPEIVVRALSWNLFHGRDFPPDPSLSTCRSRLLGVAERGVTYAQVNRPLLREFAGVLAGMEWDFALLQEAPPRWLAPLGRRCGASGALALTSRNSLPSLRAAAAELNPDLIASNEGGSNQVLVRAPWRLTQVSRHVLTRRPERRVLLLVGVAGPGDAQLSLGCLHASRGPRAAARDVARAAEIAGEWAGAGPLLLGGDLNVRPEEDPGLYRDLERRHELRTRVPVSIDHVLARGAAPGDAAAILPPASREVRDRSGLLLRLSDHPVVAGSFSMR
jgi:endonuclease/exonuclease/phosphatase family metal-dependent hydrolase